MATITQTISETITSEKIVKLKNYYSKKNRMESLNKFNKIAVLKPTYAQDEDLLEDLASAGFFYNEEDGKLKCFCCDFVMDLKPGENPTAKHWLEQPHCNFLKDIRYNGPKEIEYLNINKRIQSYGLWPTAMAQRPRQLAEAGFFYTGFGDKVQCFFCLGRLSSWNESDDPWEEHAYWVPSCQFVIYKKGLDYINDVLRKGRKGNRPRKQISNIIKEEDEKMDVDFDDYDKCATCYEKKRNTLFLPCHHFATCGSCSFSVGSCPVCRKTIDERVLVSAV